MPGMGDFKVVGFVLHIALLINLGMTVAERINSRDCGISKPADARIVQGKKAQRTQMPWMVHIKFTVDRNETHEHNILCGGSIISPRYILTAAHCICKKSMKPLSVDAIYNTTKLYRGSSARIVDFIPHPKYERAPGRNDVALLRANGHKYCSECSTMSYNSVATVLSSFLVENPLRFDDYVRPICLPTRKMNLAGKRAVVSGWGHTSENGTASADLFYLRTTILPFKKCKDGFINLRQHEVLNKKNTLCTLNPGKGSCQGDSGGPLTVKSKNSRTVQIGIVSWGRGCGRLSDPGMYTRVDNYMRWIKREIGNPRPPRWQVPTLEDAKNNSVSEFYGRFCTSSETK